MKHAHFQCFQCVKGYIQYVSVPLLIHLYWRAASTKYHAPRCVNEDAKATLQSGDNENQWQFNCLLCPDEVKVSHVTTLHR